MVTTLKRGLLLCAVTAGRVLKNNSHLESDQPVEGESPRDCLSPKGNCLTRKAGANFREIIPTTITPETTDLGISQLWNGVKMLQYQEGRN